MNKHTAGPWVLTYDKRWIIAKDPVIGTVVLAKMEYGSEIDAEIIAAAPKLQELLASLLKKVDARSGGRLEGTGDFVKTADAARDLIAKLNGN